MLVHKQKMCTALHTCIQTVLCIKMNSGTQEQSEKLNSATHLQAVVRCLHHLPLSRFCNPSALGNIFLSANQFNTSCQISRTVSKLLELDQTLMVNAIPQQQILNTNLIAVSRGQTSAWVTASWSELQQQIGCMERQAAAKI